MAHRYGSRSTSSSCLSKSWLLYDKYFIAQYAALIIFLAVYLGLLIALCVIRRSTGAGKRLIGIPYMLALFFMFIQQAINFLTTTLQACEVLDDIDSFYKWNIASYVFYGLKTMLLLYVVLWTLNSMLRNRLGHYPSALRATLIADLVILGGLLAADVIMTCYSNWSSMGDRYPGSVSYLAIYIVNLVFWAVFLASMTASGTLAVQAVRSLKAKRVAGGSLLIWISVLYLALVVYSLITVIQLSVVLDHGTFDNASYVAMYWFSCSSLALIFIALLIIAKNAAWRPDEFVTAGASLRREDDEYHHQQDPIYNGVDHRA